MVSILLIAVLMCSMHALGEHVSDFLRKSITVNHEVLSVLYTRYPIVARAPSL